MSQYAETCMKYRQTVCSDTYESTAMLVVTKLAIVVSHSQHIRPVRSTSAIYRGNGAHCRAWEGRSSAVVWERRQGHCAQHLSFHKKEGPARGPFRYVADCRLDTACMRESWCYSTSRKNFVSIFAASARVALFCGVIHHPELSGRRRVGRHPQSPAPPCDH